MPSPIDFTGNSGICIDISDLALTDGVAVAQIDDISGNGNHLLQADTSKTPIFRDDSDGKYIEFDGVNDSMATSMLDLTSNNITVVTVISHTHAGVNNTRTVLEHGTFYTNGGFGLYTNNGIDGLGVAYGSGGSAWKTQITPIVGLSEHTALFDIQASHTDIEIDGNTSAIGFAQGNGSVSQFAFNRQLYVGARNGSQYPCNMKLYGMLIIDRQLTQLEKDAVAVWGEGLIQNSGGGCVCPVDPPVVPFILNNFKYHNNNITVDRGDHIESSPFASISFITDSNNVDLTVYSNIVGTYPEYSKLSLWADGDFVQNISVTQVGDNLVNVVLPNANYYTIVNSSSSAPSGVALGSYLQKIEGATEIKEIVPQKMSVYGDSIACGGIATEPNILGWSMLVRNYMIDTALVAYGWRSLWDDRNRISDLADELLSSNPDSIWLAIGTNDLGLSRWTATEFETVYSSLLSDIRSKSNVKIYAQGLLPRTGFAVTPFNTAITNAMGSIIDVEFVDGADILDLADLGDGLHPHDAGHVKYCNYVINKVN